MAAALYRQPARHAEWSQVVQGGTATFSFEALGPPPPGMLAKAVHLVGLAILGLLILTRLFLDWAGMGGGPWAVIVLVVALAVGALAAWLHPTTRATRARAMVRRPRRPQGSAQPFVLRMTPSELSLTSDGVAWTRPVPLDRITGFWGDRHLHVEVRDGASIMLPCCLPSGDHRALAAALDRQLVAVRASGG